MSWPRPGCLVSLLETRTAAAAAAAAARPSVSSSSRAALSLELSFTAGLPAAASTGESSCTVHSPSIDQINVFLSLDVKLLCFLPYSTAALLCCLILCLLNRFPPGGKLQWCHSKKTQDRHHNRPHSYTRSSISLVPWAHTFHRQPA